MHCFSAGCSGVITRPDTAHQQCEKQGSLIAGVEVLSLSAKHSVVQEPVHRNAVQGA